MATQYKTPGVYIQEPNSFPPSIVGVDTAVPCFIGYTEFARDGDGRDIGLTPKRIDSLAEYMQFFGSGYPEQYYLAAIPAPTKVAADATDDQKKAAAATDAAAALAAIPGTDQNWGAISLDGKTYYNLAEAGNASFNLFNSIRLFYANGGGACYVISCAPYKKADGTANQVAKGDLTAAIQISSTFIGPTMLLVPDAVLLAADTTNKNSSPAFNDVIGEMLKACAKTQDRMALLDVWGADKLKGSGWDDAITAFRTGIQNQPKEIWKYGAAYFPPLVTSIVSPDEVDLSNFDLSANKATTLKAALTAIVAANYPPDPSQAAIAGTTGTQTNETGKDKDKPGTNTPDKPETATTAAKVNPRGQVILDKYVSVLADTLLHPTSPPAAGAAAPLTVKQVTAGLVATVPGFQKLLAAVAATQGVLPASAAMAGIWATNDRLTGVWNAPANTGISTLIAPKLPISDEQQQNLNVPVEGGAVNAIRTFQGRGNLVWGARTLDSLSNDWRYIQVRRTMIYIEQSVKQALEAMVFKPNTEQTWVTVTSMIESFLHGVWAAGGLMGSSPQQAYKVTAGLGSTMTPDDVLNGVMRVQIVLQMVHPAEFIELTFKQQMLGGA